MQGLRLVPGADTVARQADRDDLINVDIERLSDKVGAGPEEVTDAVFRWIEQYYDLGLSTRETCGVLWTRIFSDSSTGLEIRRLFLRFRPQQ
jgi:hypothetical protein